jgi:hypothetical protein
MWLHHKIKKTMSLFAPTKEKRKKKQNLNSILNTQAHIMVIIPFFWDDVNQRPRMHHPLETCYDLVVDGSQLEVAKVPSR